MLSNTDKINIIDQRIYVINEYISNINSYQASLDIEDQAYLDKNSGYSQLLIDYARSILALEEEKKSLTNPI